MRVTKKNGQIETYDVKKIQRASEWACNGLNVNQSELEVDAHIMVTDMMRTSDVQRSLTITAARKITREEPEWSYVASRFLLQDIYKEANKGSIAYPHFRDYVTECVREEKLKPELLEFDLDTLNAAITPERDLQFRYLGMQTVYNRYLLRNNEGRVIELPQFFFMRVAMGIALAETTKEKRVEWALRYYHKYSTFRLMPSTPTLFNSGTLNPQMSSCFLSLMSDDTDEIMETCKENAKYSKFAGGTAVSVTPIRAQGSAIKSTGGKAGGPVRYIKIFEDVINAFDQGGKRNGVGAVYLEPWHSDLQDFFDLRTPGDHRLRCHDVFPALWLPDLLMKRVKAKAQWSLFDPAKAPGLVDTYGAEFEALYEKYEAQGLASSQLPAEDVWKKIITLLIEEGVYWPCFKDVSNARYPQQQIVHSSNLCTEIILRTSQDASSVCNLHSVNVAHPDHVLKVVHTRDGDKYEWNAELEDTVRVAVRALDSVITVGMVPHEKGRKTNQEDRPIGLGIMGYTEAMYAIGVDYESADHVVFANELLKQVSLTAIDASADLAQELGAYPTFERSLWAQGKLTMDTLQHRGIIDKFGLDLSCSRYDLDALRAKVARGMRNATTMAIAPTATISNIVGTTPCTELAYDLEYEKENLNGLFTVVAPYAWRNPYNLPLKTAKSVDQMYTVYSAAARQIWLDQSQSTNIYLNEETDGNGPLISSWYMTGWEFGMKTFYYLRGLANETKQITHTVEAKPSNEPGSEFEGEGPACYLRPGDPGFDDCEACQ